MGEPHHPFSLRRNRVVAASAGTGKTHMLVGVLVHLLLGSEGEPVSPSRIVATTFSRKAAREIRTRLTRELERLAEGAPSPYQDSLGDVAPWQKRAQRALRHAHQCEIGTLHGLAARIVQAHALDLGLAAHVEIETEDETTRRIEQAIVLELEELLVAQHPFADEWLDIAGSPETLVTEIANVLRVLEESGLRAEDLRVDTSDPSRLDAPMQSIVDAARRLLKDPRLASTAEEVLSAWDARNDDALEAAVSNLFSVKASAKKTDEAAYFFALRETFPGATHAERAARFMRQWRARDRFAPASQAARDLLTRCQRRIHETRGKAIGFSDVLALARELLLNHPDIASTWGDSIDALLVDEFQDTSRIQCDLVQLLWAQADKRQSGRVPALSELRRSGLFVVGDRKQSIYGFRGANVAVFMELCVGLAGEAARVGLGIPAGAAWVPDDPSADFVALRHNRRGEPELLSFANACSARLFVSGRRESLDDVHYVPDTEDLLPARSSGSVDEQTRTTWLSIDPKTRWSSRSEEAWSIAAKITELAGATPYRDMAILAASNHMLDAAAFALAEAGIPYVIAGRGFFATREVRDMRAMLAAVVDPDNKLALLEVLRGPWAGLHDASLLSLVSPGRGLSPLGAEHQALDAEEATDLDAILRLVLGLHEAHATLGPVRVLEEAIRARALDEVLASLPRGAQRVANVRKLLGIASRFDRCEALIEHLDRALSRDQPETEAATFSESDDAVRLLTIHASKGLSFPIVFIPEIAAYARPPHRHMFRIAQVDTELALSARVLGHDNVATHGALYAESIVRESERLTAERQRLIYVAITRAEQRMYLVGGRTKVSQRAEPRSLLDVLEVLDPARAKLAVETVRAERVRRDESAPKPPVSLSVLPKLPEPTWQTMQIAPTALMDFAHCARRFEWMHVIGLPEPLAQAHEPRSSDAARARAEGTLLHRVLERMMARLGPRDEAAIDEVLASEGIIAGHPSHARVRERISRFLSTSYAQTIESRHPRVLCEHAFTWRLDGGGSIVLRGSIDLLVQWQEGDMDVIDYKSGHGSDPAFYALQLVTYLHATRAMFPDAKRIRAAVVALGSEHPEPAWLDDAEAERWEHDIEGLAARLARARWSQAPRIAPDACRAIRCGYFRLCHAEENSASH